jgi:hypothetical protein
MPGLHEVCIDECGICETASCGCATDADCDDGLYCNGQEACDPSTNECIPGDFPCLEDSTCDEESDSCESESWFYNPCTGNSYRLTSEEQTWDAAESEAIEAGGNLATVNDSEEDEWLLETFTSPELPSLWNGLHQLPGSAEPGGGWVWSSDQPVTFTNWGPGEPNDDHSWNEDACEFRAGGWNDVSRSADPWPGIIERSGPPPADCNGNGAGDDLEIVACEGQPSCGDCNNNGVLDECDIAHGLSDDSDESGVPDECERGVVFQDDFGAFCPTKWTHYGGGGVDVDETLADSVFVHGARDWSPASRITHVKSTRTGTSFDVEFDYRVRAYNGHGRVYIGWLTINDFAGVQAHDASYAWLHHWGETGFGPGHDSEGTPSSGLWIVIGAAEGGGVTLTATDEGYNHDRGSILTGHDDGAWYTVTFGRAGAVGYLAVREKETQDEVGSIEIELPDVRDYAFFHISTVDNMANNWWADFELDNLQLSIEP